MVESSSELVEERPEAMDEIFGALSHQVRRAMVGRLAGGKLTIGELAAPLPMSFAAVSKHVKVLERAGLVDRTVEGRRHVCRLAPGPLASAAAWLRFYERHWSASLDSLDDLLQPVAASDRPRHRRGSA
jgi:DNA-binding transcriptional ArsR family regulator